jgi:hypothetical protein
LGAGTNGTVYALAIGPDGSLYAGGAFTDADGAPVNRIAKWDGSAWSALATGTSGSIFCLAVGHDGAVYAGGFFATASGVACDNIAKWDGAAWSALGVTPGTDNDVIALAIGLDGSVYAAGAFHTAGGVAVGHIAHWDGSTWSALGAGMDNTIYALAVDVDDSLYAGGTFTTAGGMAASRMAKWNGVAWSALGAGMGGTGDVYGLAIAPDGLLYAVGTFLTAGGLATTRAAFWNGSVWIPFDAQAPSGGATPLNCIFINSALLVIGFSDDGSAPTAVTTTVTNGGSADAHPMIQFTGPGALVQLVNATTGDRLWFNRTLLAGEVATLDLTPGAISFQSNFRGNVIGTILPGSALATWKLAPGANAISCFVTGSTGDTEVALWHPEAHWSIDGVR